MFPDLNIAGPGAGGLTGNMPGGGGLGGAMGAGPLAGNMATAGGLGGLGGNLGTAIAGTNTPTKNPLQQPSLNLGTGGLGVLGPAAGGAGTLTGTGPTAGPLGSRMNPMQERLRAGVNVYLLFIEKKVRCKKNTTITISKTSMTIQFYLKKFIRGLVK